MNLGKFQKIELRDYWESEPADFTPWLATEENIEELGNAIGIDDIEVEGTEVFIGNFKADILGRDSNNNKIIIENQLEKSNHDHLGKIITYASGVDASIIIWICNGITDDHRRAIDWLNEHTDENINFFAIEIELWKIDDSIPAPRFNVICRPNEWAKTTKVATTSTPREAWTREIWEEEYTETVETADCLLGLISRVGEFELVYTKKYISFFCSNKRCFILEKRGTVADRFRVFKTEVNLDELRKFLDNMIQYKEDKYCVNIQTPDKQFVEEHKDVFIEIAKYVKGLKTRA